jgi:hypothetical protein
MTQIRDLLAFDGCEVMVNLAIKNLARFVEQPEFDAHLPTLFGSQRWREASLCRWPSDEPFCYGCMRSNCEPSQGFGICAASA